MVKISKSTTLSEILKIQGAEEVLIRYNVPCLFCPMARFEANELTIGRICQIYGLSAKKLIEELNKKSAKQRTVNQREKKKTKARSKKAKNRKKT